MTPKHESYEGRRIEIRGRGDEAELMIDGVPVAYGRLPNGKYFLDEYAYDWTDDLAELGRRYIAYQARVEKVRARKSARKGE